MSLRKKSVSEFRRFPISRWWDEQVGRGRSKNRPTGVDVMRLAREKDSDVEMCYLAEILKIRFAYFNHFNTYLNMNNFMLIWPLLCGYRYFCLFTEI